MNLTRPTVLVVGGHDSSGGAGVDADRDALAAAGVEARIVVSAWTKQDGSGLVELGAVPAATWLAEARSALVDRIGALKFGLLPGEEAVAAAERLITEFDGRGPVLLDPVIAPSLGGRFLDTAAVAAYRDRLLPLGAVWTPNLTELAELAGLDSHRLVDEPEHRLRAASGLLDAGAGAVLVKAGHGREDPLRELLLVRDRPPIWIERARIAGLGMRGTGCRFASALAARLVLGETLEQAARGAGDWVARRIRECP